MDRARFRDWFSRIDELTAVPCRKVAAVLSDPPEGETIREAAHAAGLRRARRSAGATGKRVRGAVHIQTATSRQRQDTPANRKLSLTLWSGLTPHPEYQRNFLCTWFRRHKALCPGCRAM